ncbi:hypothetical protein [Nonomuraea sp. NPDC023979]|uniref:hypothetical protein n=1 Tax=Nonomuraea sp. NPDC023979 TaxID=3154796 RepID=UPI0033C6BEB8
MNYLDIVIPAAVIVAVLCAAMSVRSVYVTWRFAAVTKAQYDLARTRYDLAAAYRSGINVPQAEAHVEAAEEAARQAEARLPRGKASRTYFARKTSS